MLQNSRVIAYTVFEILRGKTKGAGGGSKFTQIRVKGILSKNIYFYIALADKM